MLRLIGLIGLFAGVSLIIGIGSNQSLIDPAAQSSFDLFYEESLLLQIWMLCFPLTLFFGLMTKIGMVLDRRPVYPFYISTLFLLGFLGIGLASQWLILEKGWTAGIALYLIFMLSDIALFLDKERT